MEMRRAVWGLPQAGILANECLQQKLAPFGYFESTNTPGLWYHTTRPITVTLVVDNFGVKYVNKDNVDHLIASIKRITCSPRIGWATYIVGSNTIGIMQGGLLTYPCQGTSKRNCRSTSTSYREKFRDALTHRSLKKTWKKKPKHLSPRITRQSLMKRELSGPKKLWRAFCITRKQST